MFCETFRRAAGAQNLFYKKAETFHEKLALCLTAVRSVMSRGGQRSILYSLLNRDSQTAAAQQLCACVSMRKRLAIRAPQLVYKAASDVLVKTFRFVKNVPCFRGLPAEDQLRLVRNSWAPLLVLGLVQDSVDFDTIETQQPSMLHRILTHDKGGRDHDPGVPVGDVEGVKMVLVMCRGLKMSVTEFAFLKGAILFSPGENQ